MRNIADGLKILAACALAMFGAVVLLAILAVVAVLLMAGPLLAVAGLIVGTFLAVVLTAIAFAGPPTAIGAGLSISAIVRDGTG